MVTFALPFPLKFSCLVLPLQNTSTLKLFCNCFLQSHLEPLLKFHFWMISYFGNACLWCWLHLTWCICAGEVMELNYDVIFDLHATCGDGIFLSITSHSLSVTCIFNVCTQSCKFSWFLTCFSAIATSCWAQAKERDQVLIYLQDINNLNPKPTDSEKTLQFQVVLLFMVMPSFSNLFWHADNKIYWKRLWKLNPNDRKFQVHPMGISPPQVPQQILILRLSRGRKKIIRWWNQTKKMARPMWKILLKAY